MQRRVLPWIIWLLGAVFILYQFLLQSANSVMIAGLTHDLHISLTEIGILSSSFFYSYLLLQIPAGLLVDRYGARKMMLLGLLLCTAATLAFSFVHFFYEGMILRIIMGAGSSTGFVGAMFLICRWFPQRYFPVLAALTEAIGLLGGAIGETSLANLVGLYGWRGAMFIAGGAGLILCLLIFIFIQDQPQGKQISNRTTLPATQILLKRFGLAMQNREIWLAGCFCGFSFSLVTCFGGLWSIPFLQAVYLYSLTHAALISSFIFIGAASGAALFGHFACKIKNIKRLMYLAAGLAGIFISALIFRHFTSTALMLLFFLAGTGAGGYVLSFAYVKQVTCETITGCAMGFTNMMCILFGAPFAQPLIGALISYCDRRGHNITVTYQNALSILIIMQFMAVISVFLMRPLHSRSEFNTSP